MRTIGQIILAAIIPVALLAACLAVSADTTPTSDPTSSSDVTPAPAHIRTEDGPMGCRYASIGPVRLEADPMASADEQVWVVWLPSGHPTREAGTRLWPVWPFGYTANFAPELRVMNQAGEIIATEGEELKFGGGISDGGEILYC